MQPLRLLAFALLAVGFGTGCIAQTSSTTPKNVILFITDGCGPASFTMARDYLRHKGTAMELAIDSIQTGGIRTHASDSRVTDSAASATAYACGVKTYNGAIAVNDNRESVPTILEGAEAKGMATGLVATSRITHATPASFSAHVPQRSMEAEIAAQQIRQGIDVILGGGTRFYLDEEAGGRRTDSRNLVGDAVDYGYTAVLDRAGFDAATTTPLLGLFSASHMDYEIDRDPAEQPSLAEMTMKAITLLEGASDEGFFLMVEASRIDHAAHANDLGAHLHDILAFNDAIAQALAFAAEDGETLIVSTSDHETGGVTLGRNINGRGIYAWNPEVFDAIQGSYDRYRISGLDIDTFFGLSDLDETERASFDAATDSDRQGLTTEAISRRSLVAWTTNGHTGVDVGLYAYGPGSEHFIGNFDNTHVGLALAELMGLDFSTITPLDGTE
ncbi:MAG: alkaline phosphatase [Rhodothermales bacterium]